MPRMVDVFELTDQNLFNGDKLVKRIIEESDAKYGRKAIETAAIERFLIPLAALSINQLVDLVADLKSRETS